MVEQSDPPYNLTEILKAASDLSRREILTLLAQNGPTRVTEIAARFAMSLNAVSKHINPGYSSNPSPRGAPVGFEARDGLFPGL